MVQDTLTCFPCGAKPDGCGSEQSQRSSNSIKQVRSSECIIQGHVGAYTTCVQVVPTPKG